MQTDTLTFLSQLREHNDRDWFQAHRKDYEAAAADFREFAARLITEVSRFDESVKTLTPKDVVFRINRDVRFSKDKSPYKTHFGAFLAPEGRTSGYAGYYFHLEPGGNSMIAGGLHVPPTPALSKIRAAIDENPEALAKIIGAAAFRKRFTAFEGAERLKTVPRGYAKDHPAAELLRLKSFTVRQNVEDSDIIKSGFLKQAVKDFRIIQPFIDFINTALRK